MNKKKTIEIEDLSDEGLHPLYAAYGSLILSPNDTKERSKELFENWLEETYEKQ